jgi:hypothetical protein
MRGFWSIIHYCQREECVNIGVLVGSGSKVVIRWAKTHDRIFHVFGPVDTARLASMIKAHENRLQETVLNFEDSEKALIDFIGKEAGHLRVTYPRPSVIQGSLEEHIKHLYTDYLA